jgi:hypothetical protein
MKSSELNTNDNPPAISASSPRVHPCFGNDPNAAAVAVLTDDGISYLLPFAQFLCAKRTANPALEQDPDAPTEKMSIHFAGAEVTVLGCGLERLESRLQKYDLSYVMPAESRLGAVYDTLITAVSVTLTKEVYDC